MVLFRVLFLLLALLMNYSASANDDMLKQRITDLENRVSTLEHQLGDMLSKDRWKDPILWQRVKMGMSSANIQKLLGNPTRIEQQVFTSWYYHPSSKLHSYIWFDEGGVLGWKAPD